jgi:hypothetical protein
MSPESLTPADLKRAKEQLALLEKMVDTAEKLGYELPSPLSTAIKALKIAIDTDVAVGEACENASAALADYNNKVNAACGNDDQGYICQAREFHKWQYNNTNYVLGWDNMNSAVRELVRGALQRIVPQRVCNQLDLCRPPKNQKTVP